MDRDELRAQLLATWRRHNEVNLRRRGSSLVITLPGDWPMPFTPFHMGPGLALKGLLGRQFSLMVFGFSQVIIDIEPLVRILRGDSVLHGATHTYVGATALALAAVIVGRPVCRFLLAALTPAATGPLANAVSREISWSAAVAGAVLGVYSHVALDSIMHADMHPICPFSAVNRLLGIVPIGTLHVGCIVSGALGAVLLGIRLLVAPVER
jgi:hypothetical protein